jgi:hypothetical protein
MCLHRITARADEMPLTRKAYKVVKKTDEGYKPAYYFSNHLRSDGWDISPIDHHIKAYSTEDEWKDPDCPTYLAGVHCYIDKSYAIEIQNALAYLGVVVVEVELEGPIAEGTEGYGTHVVVYKKMRIIKEVYPI